MNRIVCEVKDNKYLLKPIKNLAKVDYKLLLCDKDKSYFNDKINQTFDKWNKKYGNWVWFDEDYTKRNNLKAISNQVFCDLSSIEKDPERIINSLVRFLYQKPSQRKKKMFWYIFGEQLYNNIINHLPKSNICLSCGKRSTNELLNGWCANCIVKKDVKPIRCVDCGKEFYVHVKNNKTCRCMECKNNYRKLYWKNKYQYDKINNSTYQK